MLKYIMKTTSLEGVSFDILIYRRAFFIRVLFGVSPAN